MSYWRRSHDKYKTWTGFSSSILAFWHRSITSFIPKLPWFRWTFWSWFWTFPYTQSSPFLDFILIIISFIIINFSIHPLQFPHPSSHKRVTSHYFLVLFLFFKTHYSAHFPLRLLIPWCNPFSQLSFSFRHITHH